MEHPSISLKWTQRGRKCVCVCVRAQSVHFQCFQLTSWWDLSQLCLRGAFNICLLCCSTFIRWVSQPWIHIASLNLSGCKCVWIAPLGSSFSSVYVHKYKTPRTWFMSNPSFMQGDLSQRTPSVQPEGWKSSTLLKPLLGNCAYTRAHSHKCTLTHTYTGLYLTTNQQNACA